jgi:CDP-2,3-bis-(O-geranylgeranyl)-sn-glycerol synthase
MEFFAALVLALPAFVANMAPVVAQHIRALDVLAHPIDGGRMWRGTRILGSHKTWRGVLVAILAGGITAALAGGIATSSLPVALSGFLFGMYAGFLAIGGDALKSIIKRRLGRESGKPWLPWDQTDYMLMFLLGTYPFLQWDLTSAAFLLVIAFFGNLATNYLAFKIGVKSTPW